jgi:hypothetical protein
VVGALLITACEAPPKAGQTPGNETAAPAVVDAGETIARHNDRVRRLNRMWSRAVVEIDWVDAKGKARFEQGDGPLILRKPHELALAVGKLGNTMYWLGSDADRYWLLQLDPPKDKPRTAYVGHHGPGAEADLERMPLPIRPDLLMQVMGISTVALPSEDPGVNIAQADTEAVVLHIESADSPGMRELTFDPAKARLQRVVIRDGDGEVIAEAGLSRYKTVELRGVPKGGWPEIPHRIEVRLPRRQATATLFLSQTTDGRAEDKVRDAQFDLERLLRAFRIDRVEVIDPKPTR